MRPRRTENRNRRPGRRRSAEPPSAFPRGWTPGWYWEWAAETGKATEQTRCFLARRRAQLVRWPARPARSADVRWPTPTWVDRTGRNVARARRRDGRILRVQLSDGLGLVVEFLEPLLDRRLLLGSQLAGRPQLEGLLHQLDVLGVDGRVRRHGDAVRSRDPLRLRRPVPPRWWPGPRSRTPSPRIWCRRPPPRCPPSSARRR